MNTLNNQIYTCCRQFCCATLILVGTTILYACGGKEALDEPEPDFPTLKAPNLVLSVPADGASNVSAGELKVTLTYDQPVNIPAANEKYITINEATVSKVSVDQKEISVHLKGLNHGKTYELIVPKGVVLGVSKIEASQVKLSFSTAKEVIEVPTESDLCSSNPSSEAKKVYRYLSDIYGKKSLSGTMANVNWNIAEAELVYKATGKYPAIAFFDYIHLYASAAGSWINYGDTKVAEDWWNQGGLIGAGWHWLVPAYEGAGADNMTYEPEKTTFRAKNATVDGTWENRVVKADLEKMAGYLKLLQDKNIPLVWRPLHEAAGNIYEYTGGKAWFWWGYDGADAYKKLWIYMFDFFKQKGINNLIWVWTTQQKDAEFYPGDEYVDIIGRDIYNQTAGADNAAQYKAIAKAYPKKMIALSECGTVASFTSQWGSEAHWIYFMPWYKYNATTLVGHDHADEKWWNDAINSQYVVTRDRLPSLK